MYNIRTQIGAFKLLVFSTLSTKVQYSIYNNIKWEIVLCKKLEAEKHYLKHMCQTPRHSGQIQPSPSFYVARHSLTM